MLDMCASNARGWRETSPYRLNVFSESGMAVAQYFGSTPIRQAQGRLGRPLRMPVDSTHQDHGFGRRPQDPVARRTSSALLRGTGGVNLDQDVSHRLLSPYQR